MSEQRGEVLFMQDGVPCHHNHRTQEWLHDHNISRLFHPANSPDLNPIEHICHKIKKII
ncbi:hypothetical protein FIBSPDRAFT_726905 [Athelia psychrophila]|uniref:Tc1-like transposase DDE domain-containing protein n=1 Tax=Athelia psychrophila TaxID=1759441 RepID=A0A166SZ71_9AGAM|nr:hypothetical protein FIBSPDRAFT_726905 [Fibularhizoctonia sp. CBS 109695]